MKEKIQYIFCIVIGIVFIFSGVGKIINVSAFQHLIVQYGFYYFHFFAPFVILLEIFMGVLLILKIRIRETAILSFVMLLLFTIAFTYGYLKNEITDCGCFGLFTVFKANIFITYGRNIILMGFAIFVGITAQKEDVTIPKWKKSLILSILLPSVFVSGMTFRPFMYYKKTHKYLNQNIENTPLINYVNAKSNRKYLLFFFSYSCPHCWNSIENYKQYINSGIVDSTIAYVLVGNNYILNDSIRDIFFNNFQGIKVNEIIRDSTMFISSVPTSFYIENDTVKYIIESSLPSPFIFRNKISKNNDN